MEHGIFGDLFDFNGDGKLDYIEQALEFCAFQHMMEEENREDDAYVDFYDDDGDFDDDF